MARTWEVKGTTVVERGRRLNNGQFFVSGNMRAGGYRVAGGVRWAQGYQELVDVFVTVEYDTYAGNVRYSVWLMDKTGAVRNLGSGFVTKGDAMTFARDKAAELVPYADPMAYVIRKGE